jgi:predicted  nucleic acid-binding Zn-ribbon protein
MIYILLTALIILAILWFFVKPRWARNAPDTSAQKTMSRRAFKPATAKPGQMYKGLRGPFKFRSDTRELAKQFQQWGADAALPKRIQLYDTLPTSGETFALWLRGLAGKELEQFTERVARYCGAVNLDIGWLNDAQVRRSPELKQAVEDAVLMYSLGAWRADSVQQDARIFLAYRDWRDNPNRHKQFGQELHGVLVQRGLVTVPRELYLAPEKERLAQATTAICEVADGNPAAFHTALRQLAGIPEGVPFVAPAPSRAELEQERDALKVALSGVEGRVSQLESDLGIAAQAKAELEQERDALKLALSGVEARASQLEGDLDAAAKGGVAFEMELKSLNTELVKLRADLDEHAAQKSNLLADIEKFTADATASAALIKQLEGDNANLQAQIEKLDGDVNQITAERDQLVADLDASHKSRIELEASVKARETELSAVAQALSATKGELAQAQQELAAENDQRARLESDLAAASHQVAALQSDLTGANQQAAKLQAELDGCNHKASEMSQQYAALKLEFDKVNAARDSMARQAAE